MTENERPLPTPPRTRFGRQLRGEEESAGPLTADRLAQAAAEGRLEEFLQREIPEGEHARTLAMMMLGMSGMAASGTPLQEPSAAAETAPGPAPGVPAVSAAPGVSGSALSPEVLAATMQGDVAGLMALLREAHARRGGECIPGGGEPAGGSPAISAETIPPAAGADAAAARPGIDKALVDELIRVGAENQVSVDWLLLRAVKLYLEEHRKTGRL